MPWAVKRDSRCPVGKPFGVVKETDDSLEGCHPSRSSARAQQAALYASEATKSLGFVPPTLKAKWVELEHPRVSHGEHGGEFAKKPDIRMPWMWKDDETRFALKEEAPPNAERWANDLSGEQRTALEDYATGGYQRLNPKLRAGETPHGEEARQVEAIRAAIRNAGEYSPDKRPTVWRGVKMGPDAYLGLPPGVKLEDKIAEWATETFKPGDKVQLGGFQSTSFSPLPGLNAAQSRYTPGAMFEIRAKGGALLWKAGQKFEDEYELLLGDDTRYRVVGVVPHVAYEANDYGDTVERTTIQLEQL